MLYEYVSTGINYTKAFPILEVVTQIHCTATMQNNMNIINSSHLRIVFAEYHLSKEKAKSVLTNCS